MDPFVTVTLGDGEIDGILYVASGELYSLTAELNKLFGLYLSIQMLDWIIQCAA